MEITGAQLFVKALKEEKGNYFIWLSGRSGD